MKKVLLLGHPLGHSASPVFQNAGFKALGVDVTYELCDIPPEELESKIKEIKESDEYLGCNVTIPYKVEALKKVDYIDNENRYVEIIGAINTIVNKNGVLWGYNTDVLGFLWAYRSKFGLNSKALEFFKDKKIFIAGAGGAGRAVAAGAFVELAEKIFIFDVDNSKASELVKHLSTYKTDVYHSEIKNVLQDTVDEHVTEADIIVNATPLGMGKDTRKSINTEVLHSGQFVFDLVYNPVETPLLEDAKQKGLKYCGGLLMLFNQGIWAFDYWMEELTGRKPPFIKAYKKMAEALKDHFGVAEL
ncbi:MAG: shikimate dehydrogenase [Candidatus Aureabacteria bacterium]|nr:shikimate dehydrogenase [Candidatus Auribacterota bacterium]